MYLIFIIVGWILAAFATLLLLAVAAALLAATFWWTRKINSPAIRFLVRAFAISLLFVPTFVPYVPESTAHLKLIDFMFKFGVDWDAHTPTRLYLASFAVAKGLLIGESYWVHAGAVPVFIATSTIWLTAIALKYVWPWLTFCVGTFGWLIGSSMFNQALAYYHRITLDSFIIAIALQASGIALCVGSLVQAAIWLNRRTRPVSVSPAFRG
jgi:hypothetical protein